jgi:hypothetical protein
MFFKSPLEFTSAVSADEVGEVLEVEEVLKETEAVVHESKKTTYMRVVHHEEYREGLPR